MSNWWAQRLGNKTHAPYQNGSSFPERTGVQQPPLDTQPINQTKEHNSGSQRLPSSAKSTDHCPNCDSSNYMAATGSKYFRCYDCGYPIQQAGSGVGAVRSDAPAKKATQVKGGGYNPTRIIGRVE